MENMEKAFGWDDEISKDFEYKPLAPGEYDFIVIGMERSYFDGSDKMPACPKAIIEISIENEGLEHKVKSSLLLHSKVESIISSFFTSIGLKKKGESLKMNWAKVIGAKGRCKIGTRTYKGEEFPDIKRWLPPTEAPQQAFQPGVF